MTNKYILSKVSVNCFIVKRGKILLVQQARPKHAHEKWSVPGGKINQGESFDEAVKREVKEEIGLNVDSLKFLGIIHENPEKTVKHIFLVKLKPGKIKICEEELLATQWFSFEAIKAMNTKFLLRGRWIYDAIKLYLLLQE